MPANLRSAFTPARLLLLGLGALAVFTFFGPGNPVPVLILMVFVLVGMLLQAYTRGRSQRLSESPEKSARYTRNVMLHFGGAALFMLSGIPLFGLPGLILYQTLISPFVAIFLGFGSVDNLPMYGGFAVIGTMHLFWPWCLPVAYMLADRFGRPGTPRGPIIYIAVVYGWGIAMGLLGMGMGMGR